MTVKELIRELSALPKNAKVIVAGDEEGNTYCEIDGVFKANGFDKYKGFIIYPGEYLMEDQL